MLRHFIESLRLFLQLFQDLPPLPRWTFLPGIVLILAYPLMSVLFGTGSEGQAFVTAFLLALAVRIAVRFEDLVAQLRARFGRSETAMMALVAALTPLLLLATVDDSLWCQRLQSAYYIIFGAMFLSDMMAGRNDMAERFWPWPEMRRHLPTMTRVMVLFNLAFLLLNETLIHTVEPSHWLLFWVLLPVLSHAVLAALAETVLNLDDDRDATA
ncbi:hypothetical protein LHP98_11005 [Rhodobacter sp. Har01]|uniref:hypothetical protein n=1 Tax=Rhodobacter sp. Har01 TaxID=2883999 RepID=UPI001D060303|nr:hypothetical protein [Rhodobacter sp. Har01]MCB6178656.1 hypothetical protein [Rhodobacter sp. Har01]